MFHSLEKVLDAMSMPSSVELLGMVAQVGLAGE